MHVLQRGWYWECCSLELCRFTPPLHRLKPHSPETSADPGPQALSFYYSCNQKKNTLLCRHWHIFLIFSYIHGRLHSISPPYYCCNECVPPELHNIDINWMVNKQDEGNLSQQDWCFMSCSIFNVCLCNIRFSNVTDLNSGTFNIETVFNNTLYSNVHSYNKINK